MNEVKLVEVERTHEPMTLAETEMVQRLIEFGRSRGWNFQPMPYRGRLRVGEKVADDTFIYGLYTNQPLHPVAEQQLFEIGCQPNIRTEQVLYGKEIELSEEEQLELVRQKATSFLSTVRAVAGAFFVALAEADPCTVAVLSDRNQFGELEYSWVMLCRWY